MKIQTTTVTQTANDILGTPVKELHYLIVENQKGEKLIVNVGKKTRDQVKKLLETEVEPLNKTSKK